MRQVVAKYTIVVQIVAIMLLHCYSIVPYAGSRFSTLQCRCDHAICGCSPGRIAARTCCCYQQKPACSVTDSGQREEHPAERGDDTPSPQLSSAPCGGSPESVAASLDKLKFLRPECLLPSRAGGFLFTYHSLSETATSRFTEPPEHPPKRFIAA